MRISDWSSEVCSSDLMCMYLPVVAITLAFFGDVSLYGLLLSLPVMALIYVNALWIAAVFALVGARFPDFGQLLNTISIFLFLLTPIIWYPEMMPPGSIRAQLMRIDRKSTRLNSSH